ncbi:MAG: FAD-dependent oxidoreductase [Sphingomicrobium sp.]
MRNSSHQPIRISRRTALQLGAASALGVWAGRSRAMPPASSQRIVVLGAGLAGLTAALELSRRGHDVQVLEWQQRVGGRVYSTSRGLAQGQVAELGAARIPDIHDFTWHYVRQFNLATHQFPEGRARYQVDGKAFLAPAKGQAWPLTLRGDEAHDPVHFAARQLAQASRDFSTFGPGWPSPELVGRFDRLTVVDWLRQTHASPDLIGIFIAANGGRVRENGALLEGIQEVLEEDIKTFAAIKGGNDSLPKAMADELGKRVLTGVRVQRIQQFDNRMEVVAHHEGEEDRPYRYVADQVICALPATILRDIPIEPALPPLRRDAIAAVQYSRASKTVIQTQTRFWKDLGVTGLMIAGTDTAAERVWDVGVLQGGSMGLLHQYCMAGHDDLDRLSASERWQRTVSLLSGVLPGLAEQTVYASHWDWSKQPWVKGGIPNLPPGAGAYLRVLPRAAGRLHFAGDYTTIWAGWMQGAIQSGVRAAQEIDPSIGWETAPQSAATRTKEMQALAMLSQDRRGEGGRDPSRRAILLPC